MAKTREKFGTSASRNLRREEKIPAIIYGENKDNENIVLNSNEVMKAFKDENVFYSLLQLNLNNKLQDVIIKNVQRHQYKNKILHIDFQRVSENSVISTTIPLRFLNRKICPGLRYGGKMSIKMVYVDIECKAKELPDHFNIDLSQLSIDQNLRLSDIKNKGKIVFVDEKKGFNRTVVSIKKPKKVLDKKDSNIENEKENTQDEKNG